MRETGVRSLSQEDPLEKEMATHSNTLAWKIPWTEEPGGLHGVAQSRTRLSDFTFTSRHEIVKTELSPSLSLSDPPSIPSPHPLLHQAFRSLTLHPNLASLLIRYACHN